MKRILFLLGRLIHFQTAQTMPLILLPPVISIHFFPVSERQGHKKARPPCRAMLCLQQWLPDLVGYLLRSHLHPTRMATSIPTPPPFILMTLAKINLQSSLCFPNSNSNIALLSPLAFFATCKSKTVRERRQKHVAVSRRSAKHVGW